jgi:peroxiredoxin
VSAARRVGTLAILLALQLALLVAPLAPALGQVDTEEDREREEAQERQIEKSMPVWQYDVYKRERDRNKLKGKSELDKLVASAQLFSLVGKDPPPFTLQRGDGKLVALSDFTGEVIMLYFWSTTSSYSAEELATSISDLQRHLDASRFTVLAVNTKEKPEAIAAWAKGRALTPVLLLDTDGTVADIYKVRSMPTVYLIGRDHKLVGRMVGTRSWEQGSTHELLDYLIKAPVR